MHAKNQKKLMMESRKSANDFSGIFGQKNKFFPKIGLCHIFGIAILHIFTKNQKKLISQCREKLVTADEGANERTDKG